MTHHIPAVIKNGYVSCLPMIQMFENLSLFEDMEFIEIYLWLVLFFISTLCLVKLERNVRSKNSRSAKNKQIRGVIDPFPLLVYKSSTLTTKQCLTLNEVGTLYRKCNFARTAEHELRIEHED
jgi:hypothetical protein